MYRHKTVQNCNVKQFIIILSLVILPRYVLKVIHLPCEVLRGQNQKDENLSVVLFFYYSYLRDINVHKERSIPQHVFFKGCFIKDFSIL